MTQAARSCKQNIAEGSAASGTSKETEIKLTNVARASLDELLEDYLDYLKSHHFSEWPMTDQRKQDARAYAIQHADWQEWQPIFASRPAEVVCNLMIVLIQQARYMLDKMIAQQEEEFKQYGGVRERMHAARTAARGEQWLASINSYLDSAPDAKTIAARAEEMRQTVVQNALRICRERGWPATAG